METIEARKIVLGRDINQFVGRMLTFIDATVEGDRATAQKDIIKTLVWDWFIGVPPRD